MKKQFITVLAAGMVMSTAVMNVQAKTQSIWVLTSYDGNAMKGTTPRYRDTYSYNKMGLVKSARYSQKGTQYYIAKFKYDKNGHIMKKSDSNDFGNEYKTDAQGNVKEDGGYTYSYNKKGLPVKETNQPNTRQYFYNKKDQLIKVVDKDSGKLSSITRYQYDAHGSVVKKWMENSKHNIIETTKNRYKYNSHQLVSQKKWESTSDGKMDTPEISKYKRIKVSSKYIRLVRLQQWALQSKNGYSLEYLEI